MLENSIILLDPSMNPDGLQRFAYWANTNRNVNLTSDPNDREYNEIWPGGRTNHYWFDLNRDWLPVQLPESQARIKTFNKWIPNILTDHHEMGTNATFFFQPGIPSRTHPLTPDLNQNLQRKLQNFMLKVWIRLDHYTIQKKVLMIFITEKGLPIQILMDQLVYYLNKPAQEVTFKNLITEF